MDEERQVDPMIQVYKWALGIAGSIIIIFGSFYINTVEKNSDRAFISVTEQTKQLMNHEQRITTLEESKRNQEQILTEIKNKLDEIGRAVNARH